MSASEKNLQDAFAGESQARSRYIAFSKKADEQGYPQVARMFRAAAEAETVHAVAHLRALNAVEDTAANLQTAIEGETHEFKHMYPQMIQQAQEEGNKAAERSFDFANKVEKIHAELYQKLADGLAPDMEEYPYHVCPVCGYTCENEPPERCPVCNAKGGRFMKVD